MVSTSHPADIGPIFVVGSSRSGTTMMGRILGRHPAIFTFNELHYFEQLSSSGHEDRALDVQAATDLAARLLNIQRVGYLAQDARLSFLREALEILGPDLQGTTSKSTFLRFLRHETRRQGRLIACEQTPRNVYFMGEILGFFPGARIINMIRDPRDVLLSQKAKWRRRFLGARGIPLVEAVRSRINYHPITISRLWRASVRAAERFQTHPQVKFLRYEDLISNPEGSIIDVCRFLDIEYSVEMLNVPRVGSSNTNDDPSCTGIDPGRSGAWRSGRLSQTDIYLCEQITAAEMTRYGYVPSGARPNAVSLLIRAAMLPLQIVVALLVNLHRTRNLWDTLRRRLA